MPRGEPRYPGDEARGVQAGREVALSLHERKAHQGLVAGQEDAAVLDAIAIGELVARVEVGGGCGQSGLLISGKGCRSNGLRMLVRDRTTLA